MPAFAASMFAGKTATRSAIRPQAAYTRVLGISTPIPNAISITPEIQTSSRCHGSTGGMMDT